jgi:alkanesulfonate monooxygenase SsuD/methylene tetrahydromethanopterin reductase-like flavin-dependent oxidoreductase (luciferase family)
VTVDERKREQSPAPASIFSPAGPAPLADPLSLRRVASSRMTVLGIVFRPQFAPEQLRAVAEAADSSGLDELWLWEDCFDEAGISAAAAALAWTQRLHVGVGVLPVPLRNPALAAMEIATLCRLFPGRIEIGLGHGVQDWMAQVGARAESPMALLREYVTALQALLAGETVNSQGRYVQLRDVTLGWPPHDRPALHVGAVGPKTVALAGELGDGLILTGDSTPDDVRAARLIYDAARPAGAGPGRVTAYLETAGDADTIAAAVRRWAVAGADAVVLQPRATDDPVAYARFAAEEVRPRLM